MWKSETSVVAELDLSLQSHIEYTIGIIGCTSKGQWQMSLSLLRTSLHRVRCIGQVDANHVKRPLETIFRVWGMLGAFESEFLIFSSNCYGVKVIFPLSFSHLLAVEVQMRHDPERYVWKPKQACYCFTKDHEKKLRWGFYDRKWKSRIVSRWPSRCELPWSWVVRVGRALERGRLVASPLHPELLLLFYSETSLMLAHSAGKGNCQAVKQAKHVGVTSEGSSFLLLEEMAWVNRSEH